MEASLQINGRVHAPEAALEVRFVRSSGPGGQNVNKVASKVQLWVDVARLEGLTDAERARLQSVLGPRLDAEGRLLVSSQATRDQHRNVLDARAKAADLIRSALRVPKARRPTKPTRASKERRQEEKRRRARRLGERRVEDEG